MRLQYPIVRAQAIVLTYEGNIGDFKVYIEFKMLEVKVPINSSGI